MRFQFIKRNQLCTNCLIGKHKASECDKPPCQLCSLKHHKLLHFENKNAFEATSTFQSRKTIPMTKSLTANISNSELIIPDNSPQLDSVHTASISKYNVKHKLGPSGEKHVQQILIGTALVNVTSENNINLLCRVLLDSGSHLNFVTENIVNLMKLKRQSIKKIISGIGGKEITIHTKVSLTISSRVSDFSVNLDFLVIPKITSNLPASSVNVNLSLLPVLADPYFHVPNKIDLLIGAEVYHQLFNGHAITVLENLPSFYPSVFGYAISGRVMASNPVEDHISTTLCLNEILHNDIKRFWELETLSMNNYYSLDEKYCEDHYAKNYKRLPSGRYSVSLPVNENINYLGSSNASSLRQFYALEKRLARQPEMYRQYREFMSEYISLGHMTLIKNPDIFTSVYYKPFYLPHHFVIKASSTTTQLRVVFNGSSNSSSKLSLNDCLFKGPTVQHSLLSIVLRFRKHIVAFTADIAKMYRQVMIAEDQQDLQRIWWRDHPLGNVNCYKLATVTYGTTSAPFLATRTLIKLALDEINSFPIASKILTNEFYVDDVLMGSDTIHDVEHIKAELLELLEKGGFQLRKFSSNVPILSFPSESSSNILSLVLGLSWDTVRDEFEMNFSKFSLEPICTKRNILSEICQLFDPLGLCSPMILTAKIIMQTIWTLHNVDWDDIITHQVRDDWIEIKGQLITLNRITVPRCILVPKLEAIQIHGFSDASEKGFGCVLYLRITDQQNKHHTRLICSKSRVAPLKKQTIPRLELCAALLLAQTLSKVIESLKMKFNHIYLWSDSEITLLRIKSEPAKFSSFIANRITQIQELSLLHSWRHVPTSQNPADFVSRGLMPDEFLKQSLWWSGPSFLFKDQSHWPKIHNLTISPDLLNMDLRKNVSISVCNALTPPWNIFDRYASFTKLLRVTAYILRYINNIKPKRRLKITGELTATELNTAKITLVKIVQQNEYHNDIQHLKKYECVPNSSNLKLLNPFLDEMGILRVGGRLRNSKLSYSNKFPLLLPDKHIFSTLLVRSEHIRLLHCGAQTLLYDLRSNYWIIRGRNLCRQVINRCIHCFRNKPKFTHQKMGDLPIDRVTQSKEE